MKELKWISVTDRLPSEEDAGFQECVATVWKVNQTDKSENEYGGGFDYWKWVVRHPELFLYWHPLPKLPEVDA